MNKDLKDTLADDILYYSGHIVGYEDSRDIAEKLLSDPNWEIRYIGGEATCNENGCFVAGCCQDESTSPPVSSKQDAAEAALTTAHIDEIAQRVAALLKERL